MRTKKIFSRYFYRYNRIVWLLAAIVFSCFIFGNIYRAAPLFDKIMSVAAYLTWHTILEFISILISFSIFILPYYSYKQNRRLRGILIASIFLTTGILDMVHTLSFKGMPLFLVENNEANRATTLWVAARLIGAIGITALSFIGINKKSGISRNVFLFFSVFVSMAIIIAVTYYPDLLPAMYIEGLGITFAKKAMEYIIIFILCIAGIKYIADYLKKTDHTSLLFAIAIVFSIFSELAFVSYTSVYDIYNYIGHVYKFVSYFIIFKVVFVNNIEKPYAALYKAKKQLKAHAHKLNEIVEKRTQELQTINFKLLQDLEYAKDIQKAILPEKLPNNEAVAFKAKYFPAERVGGDFYNIFKLDEQWIGMYIGDVSGHGVPAAMLTIFLNQSIKATRELEENRFQVLYPSQVLNKLYEVYNKVNFKDEVYILVLYAIYNVNTKELVYSSAGMNVQPLIYKGTSQEIYEIDIKGLPICNLINIFPASYIDHAIQLESGDKVLFYTDGLVEIENNEANQAFNEKNLKELLFQYGTANIDFYEKINEVILRFSDGKTIKDDITFFMMEVN